MNTRESRIVSFFTGAMGLDLGFEQAGFRTAIAVDNDPWAIATIEANRPQTKVVPKDLADVSGKDLLQRAGIVSSDLVGVLGASPCEPFSTAGNRGGLTDIRGTAIFEFIRLINEIKPKFFVYEQVPGFLRAARQHMSFYERIKLRADELRPEQRLGSAFDVVMESFKATGYALSVNLDNPKASILNAADFGTPQKRRRFILVGMRDGEVLQLPEPTHADPNSIEAHLDLRKPWVSLRNGLSGLNDPNPECMKFPTTWRDFLASVPEGGNWRSLPRELHEKALGGAYDPTGTGNKGGRGGFLRRLSWSRPSPTLVDRPTTKASCLCHPSELRPLSIAEYQRLQGFPDDWVLKGPLVSRYRLVGQATPVQLAEAVGHAVARTLALPGCTSE